MLYVCSECSHERIDHATVPVINRYCRVCKNSRNYVKKTIEHEWYVDRETFNDTQRKIRKMLQEYEMLKREMTVDNYSVH